MAIKDEGTFHLKQAARDMLRRLGSKRSQQIGWRDMWAFVTVKGSEKAVNVKSGSWGPKRPGRALGESLSKSPDFSSWGQTVVLRAEVPLASPEEANCQKWPETEENRSASEKMCNNVLWLFS